MEQGFCTEAEAREILITLCKENGQINPTILVSKREQRARSYQWIATFVIVADEGNEKLVKSINRWSSENDRKLEFFWSEINLQNNDLTADYIMVRSLIAPNLYEES